MVWVSCRVKKTYTNEGMFLSMTQKYTVILLVVALTTFGALWISDFNGSIQFGRVHKHMFIQYGDAIDNIKHLNVTGVNVGNSGWRESIDSPMLL